MSTNRDGLLQMRILIGYLGERAQFAWWQTAFYEASSKNFLDPVFSRTSRLAQYHGVLEAARRLHDEHLSVGSYHLFRLPEEIEQDLHGIVERIVNEEIVSQALQSKEAALGLLRSLVSTSITSIEGPTAVGSIKDIDSPVVLQAIVGTYLKAFSDNVRAYPYLLA